MNDKRNELVFVVRMWARDEDANEREWRGSVHDVDSGQRFYVTGTRDIADFIETRIAERAASHR